MHKHVCQTDEEGPTALQWDSGTVALRHQPQRGQLSITGASSIKGALKGMKDGWS